MDRRVQKLRTIVLAGALCSLGATGLFAQLVPGDVDVWWDGGGNNNNWNTNPNWDPTGSPAAGEIAGFDGDDADSEYSISLNGSNRTVAGIYFDDSASNQSFTFTPTGSEQLRVDSDGITNDDQVTQLISANLRLQSDQIWYLTDVSSGLQLGSNLTLRRSLEIQGDGFLQIDNRINLSGNRTLTINNAGGLTADILRLNGGQLTVDGSGDLTVTNELQNWNGSRVFDNNSSGTVSINDVRLSNSATNETLTFTGSGQTDVTGEIYDGAASAGIVLKDGSGTLALSGANTYNGATTINAGTVIASHDDALGATTGDTSVASGATLALAGGVTIASGEDLTVTGTGVLEGRSGANTYSGLISGSGGITVTGGSLTLAGSGANTYTGSTVVTEGTLILNQTGGNAVGGNVTVGDGSGSDTLRLDAANQIADAATVAVNSSGTFNLNGNNESITSLDLTAGTVTTGAGTLTLGGATGITSNASATSSTIDGNLALGTSTTFNVADGAANSDLSISAIVSGANDLTKDGAGTLYLGGANSYTGTTHLDGGTLAIGAESGLGNGGDIEFDGGALATIGSDFAIDAGRSMIVASGGGTLYVDTGITTTFDGDISGSGGLIKSGAGRLDLGTANTLSGNLTLYAGELGLGHDDAAGSGTLVFGGGTLIGDGGPRSLANDVDVNDTSTVIRIGGSEDITFTGSFDLGASDREINVTNTGLTTISGVMDNDYWAYTTKSGSGTLVLSGANTGLDGPMLITGGTLQLENSSALGSATNNNAISDGATLALNHVTGITVNESDFALTGTGDGSNGALRNLAGDNTLAGTLIFGGDTTIQSDAGSLTLGTFSTAGNIITLAGDGDITAGTVNGSGGIVITDGGNREFNGSQLDASGNSISVAGSGDVLISTVVYASSLDLNSTGQTTLAGSGSNSITATTLNSGTLVLNQSGGNAIGSIDVGDGSGTDTLRLDASNQIDDGATVNVASSGVFNLNNNDDRISTLNLDNSSLATGTGTLALGTASTAASASTTTISGNLQLTEYTNTITVADGAAANDLVISANISGDDADNRLIKAGAGTLVLSGTNTFADTGNDWDAALQIQGGTVIASADTNLGAATSNISLSSGTTLQLNGTFSTGSSRLLKFGGDATVEITDGNTVTWNGALEGTGDFNKAGTGSMALTGNATSFTGDVIVDAGTLAISADDALGSGGTTTVNSGATLALSGGITVDTETSLTLSGTGDGGIGALHNTSGTNVFDGGSFALGADTLIASSAGKLDIGDAGSGADPFNLGAFNLTLDTALGSTIQLNTELTGSGNVIKDGSGTLVYYMLGNAGHSGTTFVNDGEMQIDTVFDDNNGINGPLVIGDGTGAAQSAILRLGQAPGGSSYNLINDATDVTVNSDGLFDTRGYHELINNLTLDGGAVIGSGVLDRLDVAGDIVSTSTTQTATISGLLGLNNTVDAIDVAAGSTLSIDAKISNGGFTKTGDGTLNLSGANSFTGAVNITDGIVNASSNFALGNFSGSTTTVSSGAQLQLQGGITVANEDLVLNGAGIATDGALRSVSGSNTWTGSVNVASSSLIETVADSLTVSGAISSGGGTLTVAGAGDTTFSGTVGLGALIKEGTGTLTVSNASVDSNVYSSATINNGTFSLGGGNEILADTMNVTIGANGTFDVNTRTETIAGLYGAGTLALASGGALTVNELGNGGNAFTGTFDMDSGSTLTLDSGVIGSGATGVGAGGTLVVSGSGTLEITDDFVFDGTLEMSTGTLLLTNTGTTFDLGTLHITGNSIIDFTDADITTLNLGELIIDMGASVTAIGWTFDVDFWSADIWGGAARDTQAFDPTTRVTFNGYTNLETIWLTDGDEITVPEPSTYGAILIGSGLAVFLWRRRRRNYPGPPSEG